MAIFLKYVSESMRRGQHGKTFLHSLKLAAYSFSSPAFMRFNRAWLCITYYCYIWKWKVTVILLRAVCLLCLLAFARIQAPFSCNKLHLFVSCVLIWIFSLKLMAHNRNWACAISAMEYSFYLRLNINMHCRPDLKAELFSGGCICGEIQRWCSCRCKAV